ncbi:trehalose operon repressor [Caloramator proteoclasticus]|uniref:Trehalose operon repressor n=1 Tax=Caloramator proteoclasticus DSM 10124 TaxID=1121262 RepID=A0A1M4T0U1_9CLOT|nr:trehalose operon repressor [Caloramator proteoclasticus]SHE38054.1 transcriptional regulator, GntR family [Caloramator proteoclasticus DSM 10124]
MENSKYLIIYNDIVEKIEKAEYEPNAKLPSENELMQMYDVSRDTVRKALLRLEQNGYIQKIKGKGSFVLDINKFDFQVSGLISFKELASKMGGSVQTIVEELEVVKPDKYLQKQLQISEQDEVWKIVRARKIKDKRIILDKDFILKRVADGFTKEICQNSIYEYIENVLGLKISFAKKEIVVKNATDEDKRYLDLDGYDVVVVVKNYVYLEDMTLFQYTESRHRPDKFKFIDFARRHK